MRKNLYFSIIILLCSLWIGLSSCSKENKNKKLNYFGRKAVDKKIVNGKEVIDTLYHKIAPFEFTNQDSSLVNNETFKNKIYVADFFFTSCPTICPLMKTQMLRVYKEYKDTENFHIISHTIDPEYDTIPLLKDYSSRLGVSAPKWNFVTGKKEKLYEIGQESYMVSALEDEDAPGGYIHSGAFVLVDDVGHIRGIYDGTKSEQVDKMIKDIPILLNELNTRL